MSTFPAVLDTDATLYVANDNIQTTLSVLQNPADTVAIVASTVGWKIYMIATIDNEQELVTGITGANTLQVTRNFNGTGSASHAAGRKVSNFVDAAYHSAVSSAIQAIQKSLVGGAGSGWTQGPVFTSSETPKVKYKWSFNDPVQGVGLFTMYGQEGGPYITGAHPGDGPGAGEYHFYYHDAGAAVVGAIGKAAAFQSYLWAGSGATLTAIWAYANAGGTWTPQPASSGITNGPIGATFGATLEHSTGFGGYALSLNTYATASGPSPAAGISGYECDVSNNVIGTGGHTGIMVVDQSSQPTTQEGSDFAYGLSGAAGFGFKYGISFDTGLTANATVFKATNATVQNGIDFSGLTINGNVLNLPGFILAPGGLIQSPLTLTPSPATSPLTISGSTKTTGSFLQLSHSASNWLAGDALSMNFAIGSGSFGGNFLKCFINSAVKYVVDASGAVTSGPQNYIAAETGANNAIVATIPVVLAPGLTVAIKLAHTLQVGANTLNGTAIRSSRNPANNIATGYAVGAIVTLCYDGSIWQDTSQ